MIPRAHRYALALVSVGALALPLSRPLSALGLLALFAGLALHNRTDQGLKDLWRVLAAAAVGLAGGALL
jgi:hypothetical protein